MPLTSTNAAQSIVRPGVCTSATKPASPFDGQMIYMTDADQSAVWDGSAWVGLDPSRDRNVIINGAMQIAQRGTSTASITIGGYYTADRWANELGSLGTWTQSVENDAPTGSGLRKSLKMLCTTADASPAAGDVHLMVQRLEGQNLQQFAKGTASAKQFSLSFWVKSSTTGTYIAELEDNDNTRQVSASYTISSAGVWEKKTLIFPADTTGAFDNDNALSLRVNWWLGSGTTYTSGTLNTTWNSITSANRAVGQVNLASATNNYWQVTGVQLEAGAVATPFEFEDYGVTLQKCERYFQVIASGSGKIIGNGYMMGTTRMDTIVYTKTTMRVAPTATFANSTNYYGISRGGADDTFDTFASQDYGSDKGLRLIASANILGTDGFGGMTYSNNASAYLYLGAEL